MNRQSLLARLGLPVVIAGTLLLAACGDDGDSGDTAAPSDTPSTDAATETTAASGGSGQGGSAGGDGGEVTVEIPAFEFSPDPVQISVGDSIVWSNTHNQPHTSTGNGDFQWDTGSIAGGEAAEPVTFTEAGTFSYICAFHPFMEGTVEVSG